MIDSVFYQMKSSFILILELNRRNNSLSSCLYHIFQLIRGIDGLYQTQLVEEHQP